MGAQYSKPEDRLRFISREVNALRSSLKTSQQNISKTKKQHVVTTLVQHSNDVSSLSGKVKRKDMDAVLKTISETMEEVLKIEPTDELDVGGTVESNSFVNVPLNSRKRTSSLGSLSSKKTPRNVVAHNIPTLRDIERKVDELTGQIDTAITNKDANLLRIYKQTITVLAADLELVRAEKGTPSEKRKAHVSKKIPSLYQKVNKSLTNLKYDTNQRIKTSKQFDKQKSLQELSQIELSVVENESLLDKLMTQKQATDFTTIRNNIVENNQRLAKVDIVDNEIKERVVLLSQKLAETVKNLDQIMAKREFESKFSKSLENYNRIKKYSDSNNNADATLLNLQTLRNSLEHLEEINDTTKHRKQELLHQINIDIQKVSKAVPDSTNEKIVQDIVEDNVILRKKVKSMDKEHTVIDQFIAYWTNVKNNFNVNSYSDLSLLRIDTILQEMQESINEIRMDISKKCGTNLPNNLIRKHSQSVPKLNSRQSYDSIKNIDQVVKTKAKMYQLPSPEKQPSYVNKRFSRIEEIKLQVHYIKEKIDNTGVDKGVFKEKLEEYNKNLEDYSEDPNTIVANNAEIVQSEIREILSKIVLSQFKSRSHELTNQVRSFNGTKEDKRYKELNEALLELRNDLQGSQLIIQDKEEVLEEIQKNFKRLQEKHPYSQDEAAIKKHLQTLNDKVKRFSGTYKGVIYNQIERDLNKLLVGAEEIEDKFFSEEIVKHTEQLLRILEQRASMAQSFRGTSTEMYENHKGIDKIKNDLADIKTQMDGTPDNQVDAFVNLQSRLDLVNFELGQIAARSDENLAKEKEICTNEAQTLRNVVDAKVALGQRSTVKWTPDLPSPSYPKNDVNMEIERFEQEFEAYKQEIQACQYEEAGKKFLEFADELQQLIEELQRYKFIKNTDLHTRQLSLTNEIQSYIDALKRDGFDINYMQNVEKRLRDVEDRFQAGYVDPKEVLSIQKEFSERQFYSESSVLKKRQLLIRKRCESLFKKLKNIEASEFKKLEQVEAAMAQLSKEVDNFAGIKSDNQYLKLKELATSTISKLNSIEADVNPKRIMLLKDLQSLQNILDELATGNEQLTSLEKQIDEISSLQNNFSGAQQEITTIKEKLQGLETDITSLKVAPQLIYRKNALLERLNILINQSTNLRPTSENSSGYVSRIYNFMVPSKEKEEITRLQKEFDNAKNADELEQIMTSLMQMEVQLRGHPNDLLNEVQYLQEAVEEKLQDYDRLNGINEEVDRIIDGLDKEELSYDQVNKLDERLNELLVELRKIKSISLKPKIDACTLRIIFSTNRTSEYLKMFHSTTV
ncbi:hypothetical protein ABEB36_010128 [Hypothenemus hampei]|uniref:Uncharacterized protein n=1 Tax=Hypothenemus hampei TaxID=57062 RepID=A0ABD1EIK8_HYPHA